jgi:hypothetical protein
LVGIYSRPKLGGYHPAALFAAARRGGLLLVDPEEVVEAEWFAADQLPAELLWGQRDRIFDALAGVGGSVERSANPAKSPSGR